MDIACLHTACGNLIGRLFWAIQDRPTMSAANATAKLERALHSAIRTYMLLKHGNTSDPHQRLEIQGAAQAVVPPQGPSMLRTQPPYIHRSSIIHPKLNPPTSAPKGSSEINLDQGFRFF